MNDIKQITITHPALGSRIIGSVPNEDNTFDAGFKGFDVGIVIPTRGDRPEFLKNLMRLINLQELPTLTSITAIVMGNPPVSDEKDITVRYRGGYDYFRDKDVDVIFFLEDDDYYSPTYIETMLCEWQLAGKPELFGLTSTVYYHIGIRKHFIMNHTKRSSAMCTMIKPDLNFNWCADNEPYTDTHLWMSARHTETGKEFTRAQFTPTSPICLGIKNFHAALTGGNMHNNRLDRYDTYGKSDLNLEYLASVVDPVSLEFYKNFYKQ